MNLYAIQQMYNVIKYFIYHIKCFVKTQEDVNDCDIIY